jgi:hypothetical protein
MGASEVNYDCGVEATSGMASLFYITQQAGVDAQMHCFACQCPSSSFLDSDAASGWNPVERIELISQRSPVLAT